MEFPTSADNLASYVPGEVSPEETNKKAMHCLLVAGRANHQMGQHRGLCPTNKIETSHFGGKLGTTPAVHVTYC